MASKKTSPWTITAIVGGIAIAAYALYYFMFREEEKTPGDASRGTVTDIKDGVTTETPGRTQLEAQAMVRPSRNVTITPQTSDFVWRRGRDLAHCMERANLMGDLYGNNVGNNHRTKCVDAWL